MVKEVFVCLCGCLSPTTPRRPLADIIYPQRGTKGAPKHAFPHRAAVRHYRAQIKSKCAHVPSDRSIHPAACESKVWSVAIVQPSNAVRYYWTPPDTTGRLQTPAGISRHQPASRRLHGDE